MAEQSLDVDWAICAFVWEENESHGAVEMGGKLRVGFGNSLFMPDETVASDNAARVAAAKRLELTWPSAFPMDSRLIHATRGFGELRAACRYRMMPNLEIMQTSPVFFWLICFMSVTALAISKSGFGGALGSISTPILLFVMPPKMALGVLLPIFLITDVWVVYIWRKHVHWRFVFIMCGFGIAGQLAGWLLFDYFSNSVLRGLIGTIGLLTALNYLRLQIWPNPNWRRMSPNA